MCCRVSFGVLSNRLRRSVDRTRRTVDWAQVHIYKKFPQKNPAPDISEISTFYSFFPAAVESLTYVRLAGSGRWGRRGGRGREITARNRIIPIQSLALATTYRLSFLKRYGSNRTECRQRFHRRTAIGGEKRNAARFPFG